MGYDEERMALIKVQACCGNLETDSIWKMVGRVGLFIGRVLGFLGFFHVAKCLFLKVIVL